MATGFAFRPRSGPGAHRPAGGALFALAALALAATGLAGCADRAAPASALWPDASTEVAAAPMQGAMEAETMGPVRLYQVQQDGRFDTLIENSGGAPAEVVYQLLGGPFQTVAVAPGETIRVGTLAGRLVTVR